MHNVFGRHLFIERIQFIHRLVVSSEGDIGSDGHCNVIRFIQPHCERISDMRLDLLEFLCIRRNGLCIFESVVDLVTDGIDILGVLHARHCREQKRVAMIVGSPVDKFHELFFYHQRLVKRRTLREDKLRENVERRPFYIHIAEGRHMVADQKIRQRPVLPRHSDNLLFSLRRLCRDLDLVRPPLPAGIIFFDDPDDIVILHIADDDHRAILRTIKTIEEFQTVFVLIRHIFDVGKKTHRRVLVPCGP